MKTIKEFENLRDVKNGEGLVDCIFTKIYKTKPSKTRKVQMKVNVEFIENRPYARYWDGESNVRMLIE